VSKVAHRLLILTPSTGHVDLGYLDTMTRLERACQKRGDIYTNTFHAPNQGMIVNARNMLFVQAIRSDATHAFWWDSDVAFDADLVLALLERPEEMIARTYPMKDTDWTGVEDLVAQLLAKARAGEAFRPPTRDELARSGIRWAAKPFFRVPVNQTELAPVYSEDGKLVEASYCGFGWVLMKIEAMRRFYEQLVDDVDEHEAVRILAGGGVFDLARLPSGVIAGEDISFCQRWRKSGRKVWVAPDGMIANGQKQGVFAEWLRARGWAFQPPATRVGGDEPGNGVHAT
jgi:hypothetical protein